MHYSLLDAPLARRSRCFGKGMHLNGGPLAYESTQEPEPLSMQVAWFQALDFRMTDIPFSRTVGAGLITKGLLRVLKKDIPMPTAVGLERDGQVLLKPFCSPYYRTMKEAVLAYVDSKFAQGQGTLRDGATVQAGIPLLNCVQLDSERLMKNEGSERG